VTKRKKTNSKKQTRNMANIAKSSKQETYNPHPIYTSVLLILRGHAHSVEALNVFVVSIFADFDPVRVSRPAPTPAAIHIINMPQMGACPELEVVAAVIIRAERRTDALLVVRLVPVDSVVVLAKVQLRVVAALVAVLELVCFAVEGVGDLGGAKVSVLFRFFITCGLGY
jgi:hypothetical protein